MFARIKQPQPVRELFAGMLREWSQSQQKNSRTQTAELQRQLPSLREQRNRLLNLRLLDEIETETFSAKGTELRDRIAALTLQLQSADRGWAEQAEMATKKCLNFRNLLQSDGLAPIAPPNAKSCK